MIDSADNQEGIADPFEGEANNKLKKHIEICYEALLKNGQDWDEAMDATNHFPRVPKQECSSFNWSNEGMMIPMSMNNYDLIENIAQLYLQQLQATQNLTVEDIREKIELACQNPGGGANSAEKNKLIT